MPYVKRGGWGGARKCAPDCSCGRHPAVRHVGLATAERDGNVWRVTCERCGRIAGTFDAAQVAELLRAHRHRVRHLARRAAA